MSLIRSLRKIFGTGNGGIAVVEDTAHAFFDLCPGAFRMSKNIELVAGNGSEHLLRYDIRRSGGNSWA